ncbi:unnamed protein product, partial [Musa acuminata var. zebrina]
ARRIIAAAEISEGSCGTPDRGFINRVVESAPCELMVAIHVSLFVLAMIKESHDRVRCRQGGVDAVPERFLPFDVAFVRYFPGMGRFDWPNDGFMDMKFAQAVPASLILLCNIEMIILVDAFERNNIMLW